MESPGCLLWILDALTLFGVLAIRGWRMLGVALAGTAAAIWHRASDGSPIALWLLIAAGIWFLIELLFALYEVSQGRDFGEVLKDSASWLD